MFVIRAKRAIASFSLWRLRRSCLDERGYFRWLISHRIGGARRTVNQKNGFTSKARHRCLFMVLLLCLDEGGVERLKIAGRDPSRKPLNSRVQFISRQHVVMRQPPRSVSAF